MLAQTTVSRMPMGLPCGKRSPQGRLRWYVLRVPEGREQTTAEHLRRILPNSVLDAVCAPRVERWLKRAGVWFTSTKPLYPGYLFAATRNVAALNKALGTLSFTVQLVGAQGSSFAPLADEAAAWFQSVMDDTHVVRTSTGVIEDGQLHVLAGPLVGREQSVVRVDRHKRSCLVQVGAGEHAFIERLALAVPQKTEEVRA